MTRRGSINSKSFWNNQTFSNKQKFFTCENITIENKGKLISGNLKLTEIFNTHYTSGVRPSTAGNPNSQLEDSNTVKT